MQGKTYQLTAAMMIDEEIIQPVHPDSHLCPDYVLVEHYIMTQLTMKAGLKWWKEKGEEAVSKELGQLHWHDTFKLVDPKMMTRDDFSSALELHLF